MSRVRFSAYVCSYLLACAYLLAEVTAKQIGRRNLAERPHFKDGQHILEYDHEAFLGKGESKTFSQLSPKEAKEKLGKIIDKIDKDSDGKINENELSEWLRAVNTKFYTDDAISQWGHIQRLLLDLHKDKADYKHDTKAPLVFEEYWAVTRHEPDSKDEVKTKEYKELLRKSKQRWEYADVDKDGKLCLDEYVTFLHPHEFEHMTGLVILEELEQTDTDKDGMISEAEFINGLVPEENKKAHKDDPDYLKAYEEDFKHRDKDNDGKMNMDEVKEWLFPTAYDPWQAESLHLIAKADENEDEMLSKKEVLDKSEVFVGSRLTSYGKLAHDEL